MSEDSTALPTPRAAHGHEPVGDGAVEPRQDDDSSGQSVDGQVTPESSERPREYGGRNGPDPVRYGDWEKNGRCIDF